MQKLIIEEIYRLANGMDSKAARIIEMHAVIAPQKKSHKLYELLLSTALYSCNQAEILRIKGLDSEADRLIKEAREEYERAKRLILWEKENPGLDSKKKPIRRLFDDGFYMLPG